MGVDLKKMPLESEMKTNLTNKILENKKLAESKLNAVMVCYDGKPVGMHSVNPMVEGDYGIFHEHILDRDFRGKGLAMQSYPKACRLFIERFNLKKIVFKTPVQNTGAIKVKEKLGIRLLGEEVVSFSIIKEGTLAKVFEWTREELKNLHLSSND